MARHTPTLLECHEWVLEHCTNLLNDSVTTTTTTGDEEQVVVDQRLEDCLMAIESTRIFVNALDSPLTLTRQWIQQLDALTLTLQRATTLTNTIGIVVKHTSILTNKGSISNVCFMFCGVVGTRD